MILAKLVVTIEYLQDFKEKKLRGVLRTMKNLSKKETSKDVQAIKIITLELTHPPKRSHQNMGMKNGKLLQKVVMSEINEMMLIGKILRKVFLVKDHLQKDNVVQWILVNHGQIKDNRGKMVVIINLKIEMIS